MSKQDSFMTRFIASHQLPHESITHFASNPWTASYLHNPLYTAIPTFSRVLKPTGEDFFFSKTINSPTTIPHLVSLQLHNIQSPEDLAKGSVFNRTTTVNPTNDAPENPDCIFLLALGNPGIDGHPATVHGGVLCSILDEMMGLCVMLHHTHTNEPRASLYTVNLNTTYRAAVPTPGDVVVRAWVTKRERRKWWSRGQIVNEKGLVMTESEGLWVEAKQKLAKL